MDTLTEFLKSGTLPITHRERSALLAEARNLILSNDPTNLLSTPLLVSPQVAEDLSPINRNLHQEQTNKMKFYAQGKEVTSEQYRSHLIKKVATSRTPAAATVAVKPPVSSGVVHRANLPVSPPAATAAAATGAFTAEQFAGKQICMKRDEWRKLSASNKARFFKEGNTLAD